MAHLLGIVNLAKIIELIAIWTSIVLPHVMMWLRASKFSKSYTHRDSQFWRETVRLRPLLVGFKVVYSNRLNPYKQFAGSQWVFQAAEIGQLSFNGGLDIYFCIFFFSLYSDVLFGSYHLCYPRPK